MAFKVLIAEDDRHTRTILEHIFTKDPSFKEMDIELLLASDGEQALRYFRSHDPDLIISDLLMPKVDGFAFCRAVRESPNGKDKPLVITSAIYKETALLNRLREELGVVFFAKPFQVREFTSEILSLIKVKPVIEKKTDFKTRITMSGPFKGSLNNKCLPELLIDLHDIDATGILIIEKGRMKKEIFCQFGRPVGAESNIRHETLGNYLVTKKLLTEKQHQDILIRAKDNRISFLRSLIESEAFDEESILRYHSSLVKVRIVNAFKWSEGDYSFIPGDDFSDRITKSPVDVISLVFAGMKRVSDLDEIADRLKSDLLSTITITERGDKLKEEFVRVFENTVFNQITGGSTSLGELLGTGLLPTEVYSHIWTLLKTGMISLKREPGQIPSNVKIPMEDPYGLSSLKKAAVKNDDHEEEISIVVNMPVNPDAADAGLILDIPMEVENSQTRDLRREVRDFYIAIQDKDYFQILETEEDAPPQVYTQKYNELLKKFDISRFSDVDLGADHTKLEEIIEFLNVVHQALIDPVRKKAYLEKLHSDRENDAAILDAEVLAKKSEELLGRGQNNEALTLISKARKVNPDVGDYHALYAKAQYLNGEPEDSFISALVQAIDLEPDSILVNSIAASIFEGLSKTDDAAIYYEKVLEIQPENEKAFSALDAIYTEKGAFRVLERLHRRLIHLCGSRRPQRTIFLAKNLAKLYEVKLNDLEKAKAAWEIVLNALPHDREAKDAVKRIRTSLQMASEPPEHQYENILRQLATNPFSKDLLRAGYQIGNNISPDLTFLFAQALMALDYADDTEKAFYNRYNPPFLPRAWKQIDADVWSNITDADDLPEIGKLFETICLNVPEAMFFEKHPDSHRLLEKHEYSPEILRTIEYVSYQLNVPFPELFTSSEINSIEPGTHGADIVIYIPEHFLKNTDTKMIAAQITPCLASFWTGRALPRITSGNKLLLLLKATLEFLAPKGIVDSEIIRITKLLSAANSDLKLQLGGIFTEITASRGNINVSQWSRGVWQSGFNLSLLLSHDLKTVLSLNEEHRGSIINWSVSPSHLNARKLLGISIDI
ncbi:MAG: response regulator [Deltaproteobacteria bacterium]|nr:response regulator [Deltaproteobacteria bacterium]